MLRKKYLAWFRKGYVKRNLSARKGRCLACGICCRQIVPLCPFLTRDNKCRLPVWFGGWLPRYCRIFPIDELDQKMANVRGKCGYYW